MDEKMSELEMETRIAALETLIEAQQRQLDAQRTRWRRSLLLLIATACVGLPLTSHAVDALKVWSAGDPIKASELNDNFEKLRTATADLEAAVGQLGAQFGVDLSKDCTFSANETVCKCETGIAISGEVYLQGLDLDRSERLNQDSWRFWCRNSDGVVQCPSDVGVVCLRLP
jgi:hypothetical protein